MDLQKSCLEDIMFRGKLLDLKFIKSRLSLRYARAVFSHVHIRIRGTFLSVYFFSVCNDSHRFSRPLVGLVSLDFLEPRSRGYLLHGKKNKKKSISPLKSKQLFASKCRNSFRCPTWLGHSGPIRGGLYKNFR